MDLSIRKEIEKIGGDPDFVEFIMAWHGKIGATTSLPFAGETQEEAYQKKIKRWTQQDFGTQWKFYWKVIWSECWNARRKIVVRRNLFKLEPRSPRAKHRPRNEGRWNAIFDLRHYFIKIDGRPHMRLLGLLCYPDQDEDTFIKEWKRRKDWFTNENGVERLEQLEGFYAHNRARIVWMTQRQHLVYWKARKVGALKVNWATFDEVLDRLTDYRKCWFLWASCRHLRKLSVYKIMWGSRYHAYGVAYSQKCPLP